MQKTLTIRGERFSAQKIDALMSVADRTNGEDYIVTLNGNRYYANYRQAQDAYFAPVCSRGKADAIALMPENEYRYNIWLSFSPDCSSAAAALGSIRSPLKSRKSAENGKRGGRPRKTL